MAKKKKSSGETPSHSERHHASYSIDSAENGFVVRVSHEHGGRNGKNPEYSSRTFIAPTKPHALRIAAHHIHSLTSKMKSAKGKKGKGKIKIAKSI